MSSYDSLPAHLRIWLSCAVLPWSPTSVLKIWKRAKRSNIPDPHIAVLTRLNAAQARLLARDAAKVWGNNYPIP